MSQTVTFIKVNGCLLNDVGFNQIDETDACYYLQESEEDVYTYGNEVEYFQYDISKKNGDPEVATDYYFETKELLVLFKYGKLEEVVQEQGYEIELISNGMYVVDYD